MMGIELNTGNLIAQARSAVWDMAVQRVTDVKQAGEEFYEREVRPVNQAHDEGRASLEQTGEAEDAVYCYWSVHHDTVRALVLTRAPTLAALAFKIETAQDTGLFEGGYAEETVKALLADLECLSGDAGLAP